MVTSLEKLLKIYKNAMNDAYRKFLQVMKQRHIILNLRGKLITRCNWQKKAKHPVSAKQCHWKCEDIAKVLYSKSINHQTCIQKLCVGKSYKTLRKEDTKVRNSQHLTSSIEHPSTKIPDCEIIFWKRKGFSPSSIFTFDFVPFPNLKQHLSG